MKKIIFLSLALVLLGAGCKPSAEPVLRQSIYEPAESSPFYINTDFTQTTFEISMPNGWEFEEDNEANLVTFFDSTSNESVTLQIFKDEDPTDLIETHMALESKDIALISETEMTRLIGTGMDPESTRVTHIINKTDYGWFVYSGYEYNDNMIEIIGSLHFYEN